MSDKPSSADQGIPAVDPAKADQKQYATLQQGIALGGGSGAAMGGALGAAGGPAGSVVGAAVGALTGALAGGLISQERGPTGEAVNMEKFGETVTSAEQGAVGVGSNSHVPGTPGSDLKQDLHRPS
eukprot:jgi/Chrzof1/2454/Cz11g16110.t1